MYQHFIQTILAIIAALALAAQLNYIEPHQPQPESPPPAVLRLV